jgi:hypothetical protein
MRPTPDPPAETLTMNDRSIAAIHDARTAAETDRQLSPEHPRFQPNPTPKRAQMYVVIAHDDRRAYRRALRMLVNVARGLRDEEVELHPLPWRFDVLANSCWHALASADFSRAEIVVIAASATAALPDSIQAWLPACLGSRYDTAGAVVTLLGAPGAKDGPDSPQHQFLQKAAHCAGWAFIAPHH